MEHIVINELNVEIQIALHNKLMAKRANDMASYYYNKKLLDNLYFVRNGLVARASEV